MKPILFGLIVFTSILKAQIPSFGPEIPVTINGLNFDAMEPFISPDGNAMFFNSLNDGNTTSLFYAAKVNDSTFNVVGAVPVVNQTITPRLDAVASLDTSNNFYWVSTRNYPANYNNLHRIRFLSSSYTNFGRVYGNIYISAPGWIIMDAAVNYYGDKLLYCNARFNGCLFNMPCISALGIAQKLNDSTFNKLSNSANILANINDTANYIVYAPQISKDELELYFTRALKNTPQTEICVSVRTNTNSAFGIPSVILPMSSALYEGPTLSGDKTRLYYHKKAGNLFKLFLRYRTGTLSLPEINEESITIYPNPSSGIIHINIKNFHSATLINSIGEVVLKTNSPSPDLSELHQGVFTIIIRAGQTQIIKKLILVNSHR